MKQEKPGIEDFERKKLWFQRENFNILRKYFDKSPSF